MPGKYRNKNRKNILIKLLKMALLILLAYASVKLGVLGGDMLSSMEPNFVERVDVSSFKSALNNSLPIIDTVYNSGKISISLTGEIKNLIKGIFNFDLNSPLTILNAHSPILYSYYDKRQKSDLVARKEEEYKLDYSNREVENRSGDIDRNRSSSIATEEVGEVPEVIEPAESSTDKIALNNETKFKISDNDLEELIKAPLKLKQQKKGPQVLIVHTHTTEGYLLDIKNLNKTGIDGYSADPRYNVVRIGEELKQNLSKNYGIEAIHNGTVHDTNFNASYGKSLNTVDSILKSYPSIRMVIDLHRDGLEENKKLRTAVKVEGKSAARVMFVVGTNQNLIHPNWKENFKLAIKLHERLNELYPGLTRPIDLSFNRYNQHLSNAALIMEVGGDGDTLDEALETTKYLARVISEVIK